eukprot:CAMPEP_0197627166 /NCGR_PEP_ID=MMETSP1338-20131121/5849_1 /TAXON_ID=43686 ORGANISM="Pelagodinium beii, Strain RCC1491" /NCGR_SAMPLE_ID=MMETSP1338 /ASSEMBLY_ACC=CAM_ASM_000754 /LENGTH=410 /DNA_ID=CAMNT_0043197807 /DNA_START=39 /DNA_END=1268 /DNA_ORIENTATION=-
MERWFQDLRAVLQPNSPAAVGGGYASGDARGSPSAKQTSSIVTTATPEEFAKGWKAFCSTNPRIRDPKVLPALMRRGVPNELRPEVWSHCLGLASPASSPSPIQEVTSEADKKEEQNESSAKEEENGEKENKRIGENESTERGEKRPAEQVRAEEVDSSCVSQSIIDVIDADVARTFPNHESFQNSGGPDKLRRVLLDLATSDEELGYCQSLNFIAATFIMALSGEDQARKAVQQLIVKLGTRSWYTDGMKQLRADTAVLEEMLRERLPAVHATLKQHRFDLIFVTSKWFLCLFAATLQDQEVLRRVWDLFLGDGIEALFRVSLALFALQEDKITQIVHPDDLIRMMQDWQPDCSAERLIQTAYGPVVGAMGRAELSKRRRAAVENVTAADTRAEMRNQHYWRGGVRPAS